MRSLKRNVRSTLLIISSLVLTAVIAFLSINILVTATAKSSIFSSDDIEDSAFDCILVLGAGIRNGQPSDMLRDRLLTAISLYEGGAAPKLLMSGDHGSHDYDEVGVMKSFAISQGVPSEDIFMDHAGFSTYESIYRANEIFGAKRILIVTQKYHLYRALYIAEQLDLAAIGVSADIREYAGDTVRDVRELFARTKDFFMCIFKPLPTHMGDPISLLGDGNVTNE